MTAATAAPHLLQARDLGKGYPRPTGAIRVLQHVDLDINPGDFVIVEGRSGSGKTTLLNLLSGLDRPSSGTVSLLGRDLAATTDDELSRIRCRHLGVVFQNFGLLPMLSAAENIEVPLRIAGTNPDERRDRVTEALTHVGLTKHRSQRPTELSGGQQQRVGIARAIINHPDLLLADEPTAQLDSSTADEIVMLISRLVHTRRMAAIITTHQAALFQHANTTQFRLHDGILTRM